MFTINMICHIKFGTNSQHILLEGVIQSNHNPLQCTFLLEMTKFSDNQYMNP